MCTMEIRKNWCKLMVHPLNLQSKSMKASIDRNTTKLNRSITAVKYKVSTKYQERAHH
jgi:hypothetical protein